MVGHGRYSEKPRTATTCIPALGVSLTLHALSGVSPKNISHPANANGSVGGHNDKAHPGLAFSAVSEVSVISAPCI
jgi:hypothetical protein